MKLLPRYISVEILKTSLGSLLFFVFVLLSGNTVRDLLDLVATRKLSLLPALCLILALLPAVISYAMPLGLISGIFIVLGRMGSSGEITAMKSAGVGIKKIAQPIIIIAVISSVFALVVNFYWGPNSMELYRCGLHNAVKENPMEFIAPGTFIDDFPGYLIYCGEMGRDKFYNFHIWEMDTARKVISYGRAKSGELAYDENSAALVLVLENGNIEKRPELSPESFYEKCMPMISYDRLSIDLCLDDIFSHNDWKSGKISHMNLSALVEAKNQADLTGDTQRSALIMMQLHKNLAMACGVFVLALLAIPLALIAKKSDNFFHFTLALILSLCYYFLMSFLSSLSGVAHGHWLVWLPNMALLGIAIPLIMKVWKH
ncbi:MAG: LptF/LptG family permease [Puniceicoccales bacterium]|jgi:lipopolysaccharide export system permease protein|nr:LptF/LptG family permease [Puniceicoccales bacterium]